MCSVGFQLPTENCEKICQDFEVVVADFMSKCQNFLLFLRKIPFFVKIKAKMLKAILCKCSYGPLAVYVNIPKLFVKKCVWNTNFTEKKN